MHEYFCIAVALIIFLMLIPRKKNNEYVASKIVNRRKGDDKMHELAKQFIGKECLLYTFSGSQIEGTIKEICENAVLIENKGSIEAVNLEFITRIREYPRNKKGKKKSVVLD